MTKRARGGALGAALGLAVVLTACTEKLLAPGHCPEICSTFALTMVDTVLALAIYDDSSFGRPVGYVSPHNATGLAAKSVPGRESRPIFRTIPIPSRIIVNGDTATGPVVGVDSLQLTLAITGRDTAAHNLVLSFYALPLTIDSSTAFHDLDGPFALPPIRSLNLDSLLAKADNWDPVTGDSANTNTPGRIILRIGLDSAQAPLVVADSGKLAFGIRIGADSRASATLGALENTGLGPVVTWFLKVDSLGGKTIKATRLAPSAFDGFVFDPPAQPIGSTLVVGGVPSTRTMLRLALPRLIRDSSRVIRATLEFEAAAQLEGSAADSFRVVAHPVIADFGAKSPLSNQRTDTTWISVVPLDTVRIDVTRVVAYWTTNTVATTLMLRQLPEGAVFGELRFHSSADFVQRPKLHITYAPRYPVSP